MPVADLRTIDVLWIALSAFLVVVGLTLAYVLFRLGGNHDEPYIVDPGPRARDAPRDQQDRGEIDRVNTQLDKVDLVTDSAVDAADSLDTAVRAVTLAITQPVQKISGLVAGLAHGLAAFRTRRDVRGA